MNSLIENLDLKELAKLNQALLEKAEELFIKEWSPKFENVKTKKEFAALRLELKETIGEQYEDLCGSLLLCEMDKFRNKTARKRRP